MCRMKSAVQKTVSIFSVLCMMVVAFQTTTVWASGNCGEGVTYALSGSKLTISGEGEMNGESPWSEATIDEVVIEDGVTKIPSGTFSGLTALQKADIAESVTNIENGAFPAYPFEIHGWINHASGRYAATNNNVTLKMKKMRILCLGNSHTNDYHWWIKNVLKDLDINNSLLTDFYVELLFPMGGRSLHTDVKNHGRGTHFECAQDPNDSTYAAYQQAFAKTWDLVIIQDYDESALIDESYPSTKFAEDMQETVRWMNTVVPGADIAWFADWVSKSVNGADKLSEGYAKSIEAIQAVQSLSENKPDLIINGSTILANARTTYLNDTKNKADALLNWDYINADTEKEVYNKNDFAAGRLDEFSLLERDGTHMSLELGRQLMATAVIHKIFDHYDSNILKVDNFRFFESIKTAPEFVRKTNGLDGTPNPDCIWQGEFVPEYWGIIREVCENTLSTPLAVTECSEKYKIDPTVAKEDSIKNVLNKVVLPSKYSQGTLDTAFKAKEVVSEINTQTELNISADDIAVMYKAPINGTEQNQDGTDGSIDVSIKYAYGYSSPAGNVSISRNLNAVDYDNTVPRVHIKSFYENDGIYQVCGRLSGEYTESSAIILLGVYFDDKLIEVQKQEIADLTNQDKSFTLASTKQGDCAKIYIWDGMDNLTPIHESMTLLKHEIITVNKANGVIVSWNAVPGAVSYDVYRDGILIADSINETSYSDKYFDTIEGMRGETYTGTINGNFDVRTAEANKDYVYTVVTDNNQILKSKAGKADASNKIAYITFDKGDTSVNLLNDNGDGIKIVATDEHMNAKTTVSGDKTNRYVARTVKTTTDADGYLKYSKTDYPTPTVIHLGDNKGGTISSAFVLGGYKSRYGIHGGQIITGEQAYVYKTDADGYLLDASDKRVKNIADAAFTNTRDSFTFTTGGQSYTTENVYDKTITSVPYAYVNKAGFENGEYVFLMNARINSDGWTTPAVYMNGTLTDSDAKEGVTVVETGTKLLKDASTNTYSPKTGGFAGEYYTYRFKANVDFSAESAASVANTEALVGNTDSFAVSDFSSDKWNLKLNAANIKDFIWIHSITVIPSDEYID